MRWSPNLSTHLFYHIDVNSHLRGSVQIPVHFWDQRKCGQLLLKSYSCCRACCTDLMLVTNHRGDLKPIHHPCTLLAIQRIF